MRFLKEFFNPLRKCERFGHKLSEHKIKLRKYSKDWRMAVTDYNARVEKCDRCGKIIGPPFKLEEIDSYTSCSMPNDMWSEIS